jgi:hypothetical protein
VIKISSPCSIGGFTIRNGYQQNGYGGGIFSKGSQAVQGGTTISGNWAHGEIVGVSKRQGRGGGIFHDKSMGKKITIQEGSIVSGNMPDQIFTYDEDDDMPGLAILHLVRFAAGASSHI